MYYHSTMPWVTTQDLGLSTSFFSSSPPYSHSHHPWYRYSTLGRHTSCLDRFQVRRPSLSLLPKSLSFQSPHSDMYKKKETRNSWYILLLSNPVLPPNSSRGTTQAKRRKKRLYVMYTRSITIQTSFFVVQRRKEKAAP
jgi:hypothetical protein